jgi:hypothetical protein
VEGTYRGAGAVSVGVAQLDRAQLFSFQFDQAVSQWFRAHVLAGDLTGKARTPGPVEPRAVLAVHPCRDARCGHDSGVREAFEYRGSAEEVIAVRVGDEDGGHVLARRDHPVCQGPRLVRRHERIHQDRVLLTVNER